MKPPLSSRRKARMTHAEWDRLQQIRLRFLIKRDGAPVADNDASLSEAIGFLLDLVARGCVHPPDTLDANCRNARLRAHVRRNQIPLPLDR